MLLKVAARKKGRSRADGRVRLHAQPRYEASLRAISNGLHWASANVKFDVHDYCGPPGVRLRGRGVSRVTAENRMELDVNFIILAKKLRPNIGRSVRSLSFFLEICIYMFLYFFISNFFLMQRRNFFLRACNILCIISTFAIFPFDSTKFLNYVLIIRNKRIEVRRYYPLLLYN